MSKNKSQNGFADVNGAKLYYEIEGEGYPLLLLHAGVADHRMWNEQVNEYKKEFKIIRYDLRGFGKSIMPSGSFSHHDDAALLLKFLNIDKAIVIGLSFGGYVAIDFAIAYPEMVDTLILGAPALSGYEPSSDEMQRFFTEEDNALQEGNLAAATEINLRMWVDGPNRLPDQVDTEMRNKIREMQFNTFSLPEASDVEVIELIPPAIKRLNSIKTPTLVLYGDQDVLEFQQISKIIAKGIPNAKLTVISEAAHLSNMEKPEKFNEVVMNFLKEIHS